MHKAPLLPTRTENRDASSRRRWSPVAVRDGARFRSPGDLAASIGRARFRALFWLHEGLIERFVAPREVVPTRIYDAPGPPPRLLIRWVLQSLGDDLGGWNFVDVGSGRGRVLMEAARFPFRRVLGVEPERGAARDAEENLAGLSLCDIRAGRASVLQQELTAFVRPDGPTVFFLASPVAPEALTAFVRRMMSDREGAACPLVFLALDAGASEVLGQTRGLERAQVADTVAFQFALLSPLPLNVFRTPLND